MKKEKAREHITATLLPGESMIGFFTAIHSFSFWLMLLLGPLAALAMRHYFVAVTDNGVHFFRLTLMGKFSSTHDFFPYSEIESIKFMRGLIQRPVRISFSNGQVLKLRAQLKGLDSVAKLDTVTQQYLMDHIKPE